MGSIDLPEDTSVAVTTVAFNEGSIVDIGLESVRDLADEVVFVDNGSTDGTQEVAEKQLESMEIPYQIHHKPELDLADLRYFAIQQTDADWILIVDADHAILDTDIIRQCIREAGKETRYYRFKYLRLFGDFEHTYKDKPSIGGLHPALIRNSAKIINAKEATRFNTPYLDEPIRYLWQFIPDHNIDALSRLWSFISESFPGSKSRDLPHLPYHKRVDKDLVGVNMNGCKSASRMLCRQDLAGLEQMGREKGETPTLKEFSMGKRGFESVSEYDDYATEWFLEHLREEVDRLENQVDRRKEEILPPVILDEIANEPRYRLLYDDGEIVGRIPDIQPMPTN